ncbi:hypothetical protein [Fredinandcohnia onubensis]|uniref:hypothetical protein n=1 Tax=Fredinandcohnia onubensis TaxID=1571209 RepID=UPI000C0C0089|nr:hypothetical protein [Fredinandcohnia onubensis]
MSKYAVYKNKDYSLNIRNNVLRLRSNIKESGFSELVDLAGNKHDDIFIKEVSLEDVELVYELKINAIYQGKEFETNGVDSSTLEKNYILLFSMDYEDVNNYGFVKHEQFVYQKEVKLVDIDSLVEIKKPILKWENQPESRKTIPNNKIQEYLS